MAIISILRLVQEETGYYFKAAQCTTLFAKLVYDDNSAVKAALEANQLDAAVFDLPTAQIRLDNKDKGTKGTAFVVYEDIYDAKAAVDH